MASAGLFRGRRPTGRYWFLLGICSFVLLMMWMPYLVSLGGDAPGSGTAVLNDESRRVVEVVVMLIVIGILFLVGMSTPRDWAVGIGNARRIAGIGGTR